MRISDWSSDVCSSDLAEVHVVDGGDGGEALPKPRESAEREALDVVLGVGPQALVAAHGDAVVDDDLVVGDGRQLRGSGCQAFTNTDVASSEERRVGKGCVSTGRSRRSTNT